MNGKRGIAPLLATALLIVLAIGLGVVVMNFGRAQIEVAAQCSVDIGLKAVALGGRQQLCLDRATDQLFFIVENGKHLPIESLRLRVIGEKAILAQDLESSRIDKEGTLLMYVPYPFAQYGQIRQVRLTPQVSLYDEVISCAEQALTIENVRDCES